MNSAADETFQSALAALRAQNTSDAERLFKALLREAPGHVGGLNLLAVLLTQLGRFEEAEHYIELALKANAKSDATHYNHGIILKALKRPADALASFDRALAINAGAAETWNNRGTVLNDLQRHAEAIADFDKAIAINPRYADAFFNKARSLAALKSFEPSLRAYERVVALNPALTEAWLARAGLSFELGRYHDALAAYERAAALAPHVAEAALGRGKSLATLRRYNDAAAAYERAVTLLPNHPEAWLGRGTVLFALGRYDDALAAYDEVLALSPTLAEAWNGRGIVFAARNRIPEASAAFDKALQLDPGLAEAWLGRGNLLNALEQHDDARSAYDKALALRPDLAEAWLGRGNLSADIGRSDDAVAAYDKALGLTPDLAPAWLGRGNAFAALKQYDKAFAAYDRALALNPDLAEAWLGRGNAFTELKQYDKVFAAYDRALALNPDLAEAWLGRGNAFAELKQFENAVAAHDRALAIKPDLKFVEGDRLHAKMHLADWTNLEQEVQHLVAGVTDRKPVSSPFHFVTVSTSPAAQRTCAEDYAAANCPAAAPALWGGERYRHERIRLAYVSADFRNHPVAYLTAGLFEAHDRLRFETTAVSIGPDADDEMRTRLRGAFERFVDARTQSDQEIAALLRELEIDIAVDLTGYTGSSRPAIFAQRPTPVQATYLGYPGTMGTSYFDYIIADRTIIPPEHDRFYAEKVAVLPHSYQANDGGRRIAERTPTRAELQLPETGFVFCCFNNAYKLGPTTFQIWMRLLKATDRSVLWLSDLDAVAKENLRREAQRCGVVAERLIFAPRVADMADHLARHRQADLFLDTLPFNAHTTASDALWAGLPVLTCLGSTLAGRVATSLVGAVGLPELATASLSDYETLALKIAGDPEFCAALKAKLARNRATAPLFDTRRFTRYIEAAYTTMWQRAQTGHEPVAFAVEVDG